MTDTQNKIDMNDHYIRHKKTYFKLSIISGILSAVLLPLTVVFWFKLDAVDPDYQVVNVRVNSAYDAKIGNDVYVNYNNKEYKLVNVTDSEFPKYKAYAGSNMTVEVYLGDDGRLYSNVNGIGHNTLTGKLYFAFLFATFALIMSTGVLIGCVVEAKKREKGIYPRRGF